MRTYAAAVICGVLASGIIALAVTTGECARRWPTVSGSEMASLETSGGDPPVIPPDRVSVTNRPADSMVAPDEVQVTVSVLGVADAPVCGARVLVSTSPMAGILDTNSILESDAAEGLLFDGRTGTGGSVLYACPRGGEWHLRVLVPGGVPVLGPTRLIANQDERLTFRLCPILVGAFLLDDSSCAVRAVWDCATSYEEGLEPPFAHKELERIAGVMGLPLQHVRVAVQGVAASETSSATVSIYHERVGWFRASVPMVAVGSLHMPTVLRVPYHGIGKPVKLKVNCLDSAGAKLSVDNILVSGAHAYDGFPGTLAVLSSGYDCLLPPGGYVLSFGDAALNSACMDSRKIRLDQDTEINLRLRWAATSTKLIIYKNGTVYHGPLEVVVHPSAHARAFRYYAPALRDGAITVSLAAACDNVLRVTGGDGRQEIRIRNGEMQGEYTIML